MGVGVLWCLSVNEPQQYLLPQLRYEFLVFEFDIREIQYVQAMLFKDASALTPETPAMSKYAIVPALFYPVYVHMDHFVD